MSLNAQNELVGSVRLINTAMPNMLGGPFKSMFPEDNFTSPLIWEASRFAVVGERCVQPNQISTAACELVLGTIQFGLSNGARHIAGVYETGMSRVYRRCGLAIFELGRHTSRAHGTVFLGLCEVSKSHEASILAATGLANNPAPFAGSLAA